MPQISVFSNKEEYIEFQSHRTIPDKSEGTFVNISEWTADFGTESIMMETKRIRNVCNATMCVVHAHAH